MERKTSNTKYDFGEFSEKARKALEKMKATQRPGERGGQVKKTGIIESMKTEIRAMLDDGYSAQQIADALSNSVFPVLPKTITQIAQGTTKTRRKQKTVVAQTAARQQDTPPPPPPPQQTKEQTAEQEKTERPDFDIMKDTIDL
jgi:hypothetical protein